MGSGISWPAYMALFAVYFFWGTTYLAIRMALEAVPPVLLIGARFFISGGILLIAAKLYGATFPRGRELKLTAVYGMIALGGGNGALVFSEQWVPSGIAALFVTTSPFWMVGIDALRGEGDKLSKWTITGIAIGFLGIVVLVGPAAFGAGIGPMLIQAFLVLQFGSFCWCLGSVLQKSQPTTAHPIVSGAVQQFATGLAVLPLSFLPTSIRSIGAAGGSGRPRILLCSGRLWVTAHSRTRWNICPCRWFRRMLMSIRLWLSHWVGCSIGNRSGFGNYLQWCWLSSG